MYSGEYDACDVTLSVYPHRASLKNMPGRQATVGIEPCYKSRKYISETLNLKIFFGRMARPHRVILLDKTNCSGNLWMHGQNTHIESA
jgi:hypothetical protein